METDNGKGIKRNISVLLKELSTGVYEKEHLIALALLSSIAGESMFLLGPPGTAKSLIARRLKEAFEEQKSFEYLMSRFSTPDEIFGPVSISKLKDEDTYERRIEGFLPSANIVFLDEIWKAGPSIQNALLTAINEKVYQNGNQVVHLPMKGLIAASNELPPEDEGLEALWDRFLIRAVSNCIANERTFYKMLLQKPTDQVTVSPDLRISDALYREWQQQITDIKIGEGILSAITAVRVKFRLAAKAESVHPFDFYVSDRRWKKISHLMQASAFLNGRDEVEYSDLFLLYYTLWNRTETIPEVLKSVTASLFVDIESNVIALEKELGKKMDSLAVQWQEQDEGFKVYNHFYIKLLDFPNGNCYFYLYDYKYMKQNKDKEALLYWDEKQHAFFIRCFDVSQPFSAPQFESSVQHVKLHRTPGCLSVNGQTYAIEKKAERSEADSFAKVPENNWGEQRLKKVSMMREMLALREENLVNTPNLFVSPNDLKLARKYASQLEKRMNELEVKLINSQSLLYGE